MIALITKLDGTNGLLFHMEHCDNLSWQWRVLRMDGSWGPEQNAAVDHVYFQLEHPDMPEVKVQWRESVDSDWQDAVPYEFGEAVCRFVVRVTQAKEFATGGLRVCGVVGGHPSVWRLEMPNRMIAAEGEEVLYVNGTSLVSGLGQVLREFGEFQCSEGCLGVANDGASQAALLEVATAVPESLPHSPLFMVRAGRLSPEEIELLKEWSCQKKP